MNTASHNLERSHQSFVSYEEPMPFFKGLAEYLEYVFTVPELKKVLREQMEERNQLYVKVAKLEEQSLKELDEAKIKLLKLIEKLKVDEVCDLYLISRKTRV